MIVLDTNVVSALVTSSPEPAVLAWVRGVPNTLVITSVVRAELMTGLMRMPAGRRRDAIAANLRAEIDALDCLPFDVAGADAFAAVVSERMASGRPIGEFDAMIAAVCLVTGASLATRNTKDFEGLDLDVINPWASG